MGEVKIGMIPGERVPFGPDPVMPPPADVLTLAESIRALYPDEFRELAKALWRCGVRLERVETKP